MASIWQWLFDTSIYSSRIEKDRALLIYRIIWTVLGLYLIFALFVASWNVPGSEETVTLLQSLQYRVDTWLYVIFPLLIPAATLILARQGHLSIASWGPSILFYLLACLPALLNPSNNFNSGINGGNLMLFILLSGLFSSLRGLFVATGISIVTLIVDFGEPNLPTMFTMLLQITGACVLIYYFVRFALLNRSEGAQEENQERLKLAEINTEITRMATQRGDIQSVLNRALELILKNYPKIYHAQVFLVDEQGNRANLAASTGDVGRILLSRRHNLPIGSLSVIGQTVLNGSPTIAIANAEGSIHRPNELLPNTRVEAAFPLSQGDEIVGALDLQSLEEGTFVGSDIQTFQALADSLALIIDNARQFELTQAQIEERQVLAEQARSALGEVERLNKRLTARSWAEFMQDQDIPLGFDMDFNTRQLVTQHQWDGAISEAAAQNNIIKAEQHLGIPLRVRGQVIGAMEFEFENSEALSAEDMDLIQEISDRVGLAAENIRLLQESQRIAQREQLINEVNSRIQSSTTVEATMTETAHSLNDVLKTHKVSIRLGIPSSSKANGNAQHSNGKDDKS